MGAIRDKQKIIGITLTELLVVIIIMGVLASLLMPTIVKVRDKARRAQCINQLKQIGIALKTFQVDNGDYPSWLSNLHPTYIGERWQKTLICPNDYANPPGSEGRLSRTIVGIDRYEELNDCEGSVVSGQPVYVGKGRWSPDQPKVSPHSVRNPLVRGCSYSYEFAIPQCSYWTGATFPDDLGNRDGVVSWREVKTIAEGEGIIDSQGHRDPTKAYDGRVPIVRCFWHLPPGSTILMRSDPRMIVLNLRCGDMSVNLSDATEDGWKKDQ